MATLPSAALPPESPVGPDSRILERNLGALAATSPAAARLIRQCSGSCEAAFAVADDGSLTATLAGRQLASRRRPLEEAARLAATVPLETNAGVVVLGFGLGHHLAALAGRMKRTGVLIAFEPDIALLRAVFERVDHSGWMRETNFVLFTDPEDNAAISSGVRGVEGLLAVGVKFLDHPPSKARLGSAAGVFSTRFTEVMRSVRTTVLTTLVQVETTLRNMLGNVERYAGAPGIAELEGMYAGRPAVVVSAGPSLHRNIDQLAKPGVRDRVVIIAVQTVLKTLLARGIKPHFVTALDYAEVSKRFYEGLSANDVEGVTLVVEPKAHPAILKAYPGLVRCPEEKILDTVLGPALARPMGELKPGATVAHLAYYLARHLGCDPVILVGQDLGFTDGQYYYAGAAIHQVWSAELSEVNTLEMMEWQRIVRSRSMLHKATDFLGRPVYTDEQMTTYLAQFERDFMHDAEAGLTVIDATEGGVAKRHTKVMTLAEAIGGGEQRTANSEQGMASREPRTANREQETGADDAADLRRALIPRLRDVRQQVWSVGSLSRQSADLLREMKTCPSDNARVNRLIAEVYARRDKVHAAGDGYSLVQFLNQTGSFNRFRADRSIELDENLSPKDRQARQIDRDITNVTWLADAADELGGMLDDAVREIEIGAGSASGRARAAPAGAKATVTDSPKRVMAVIQIDPFRNGLGSLRDLSLTVANGRTALALTLARLARCRALDGVVVLTPDPGLFASLAGPLPSNLKVHLLAIDGALLAARGRAVGVGRLFSRRCWRGGLAGLSVFDEACCPALVAPVMEELQIDAAVVVGPDWALIDPELTDRIVARHLENPGVHRLVFSQAPPGLAPCLVSRTTMAELARNADTAGPFATIGALLSYIPVAPQADPIAKPVCIGVEPHVRDLTARCIPDSDARRRELGPILERIASGQSPAAPQIAEMLAVRAPAGPEIVRLEICTLRTTAGQRAQWLGPLPPQTVMSPEGACAAIDRLARNGGEVLLSLEGRGDPLLHPAWRQIVRHAVGARLGAVHVRTDLSGSGAEADDLVALGVDVISVDLLADTPAGYHTITGTDLFEQAMGNVSHAMSLRKRSGSLPFPWIVPRLTRCDAVYAEIENFYDHWLMSAGAAVIDPLPRPMPGQRIERFPLPDNARRSAQAAIRNIHVDGSSAAEPVIESKNSPAQPAMGLAS